jgi:hypothetical protein
MARRLVALGRKRAEFHTVEMRIDNHPETEVAAAGLLPWRPRRDQIADPDEPDYDLLRKLRIESDIAWGEGSL